MTEADQSFLCTRVVLGTVGWHSQWEWRNFLWEWCSLTCAGVYMGVYMHQNISNSAFWKKSKKGNNWKWQVIQNITKGTKITTLFPWKLQGFHLHTQRTFEVFFKVARQNYGRISCSLNLASLVVWPPHSGRNRFLSRELKSIYEYILY